MRDSLVNLIKLCVGIDSLQHLTDWHRSTPSSRPDGFRTHTTRMWPKRETELLNGGSLYWVIKGEIQCRQQIMGLEEQFGHDGIRRCTILLNPKLITTQTAPRRAFQGWRYLAASDSPADLKEKANGDALPADLARELAEIGVR